ncbi:MAG TPA: hypothetical protein VFG50_09375 [Rhodothermales bacterium]|nr:hypothetical protein [Rhodothermales bacterium]
MEAEEPVFRRIRRIQHISLLVGVVLLIVLVIGALLDVRSFFRAYLFGFVFWTFLAVGCLGVLMLHHVVAGPWGFAVQRYLEAGARTFPLLAALFIPLIFGLRAIYPWLHPEMLAAFEVLRHKQPYLNVPFFLIRTLLYFVLWSVFGFLLSSYSRRLDREGDVSRVPAMRKLSAGGLVVFFLTATFSAIDWVMSIAPEWHSTIYGFLVMSGEGLSALSFVTVLFAWIGQYAIPEEHARHQLLQGLGNLILAFISLWAYMSFAQLIIIWSGNLPTEVRWYMSRTTEAWFIVTLVVVILHFTIPFVLLLFRQMKREPKLLGYLALFIFAMRAVEVLWLIKPSFQWEVGQPVGVSWLDPVALLGLGAIWFAEFLRQIRKARLLPYRDPRMIRVFEEKVL